MKLNVPRINQQNREYYILSKEQLKQCIATSLASRAPVGSVTAPQTQQQQQQQPTNTP